MTAANDYVFAFGRMRALAHILLDDVACGRTVDVKSWRVMLLEVDTDLHPVEVTA